MKSKTLASVLVGASAVFSASAVFAAAIAPGDLVVYQVGTGTAAPTSAATAVFLDEYTPAGTLVQQIAVNGLTASGTATSEGAISLSPDGTAVAFAGYNAAAGTASIAGTTAAAAPRGVGVLTVATGAVDTSTVFTGAFSGNNPRGAVISGTSVYAAGASGGVQLQTLGSAATPAPIVAGNDRALAISNGQLYVSSSSATAPASIGISAIGTGLPTATSTEANVGVDTAGSPYAFAFASLGGTPNDTLYVVDSGAGAAGGILKYSLVNGSYVATGSIADPGSTSATETYGLTATVVNGSVDLFVTTPSTILSTVDSTGYDATLSGSLTTIATAGTNTFFRGIAVTPGTAAIPEPASLSVLALLGLTAARRRRA